MGARKTKSSASSPPAVDNESKSAPKVAPKARLSELIKLILETARVKGWNAYIEAEDTKNFRYATIAVSRYSSVHEITGTFEILCDERVKISYHNTSFYNWGLSDLYDAISNEFYKLSWIEKKDDKA